MRVTWFNMKDAGDDTLLIQQVIYRHPRDIKWFDNTRFAYHHFKPYFPIFL